MTKAKPIDEQIESVQDELKKADNHLKELIQKHKYAERNARTRRLIERGAILESLIVKPETLSNEEIKVFLEKTITTDYARKVMYALKGGNNETVMDKPVCPKLDSGATPSAPTANSARETG